MEALQLKDFLHYRYLSGLCYAPDGRRAAFVVSNASEEDNGYESRLYLLEDGRVRQLTDLGRERSFVWLDSHRLLFAAARSAKERKSAESGEAQTSFYCLDVDGGEAVHAFTLPFAAGQVTVLDETHLAVSGSIDAAHPDEYLLDAEGRAAAAKRRSEEKDYEVFDELPFWANGGGVTNKQRSALFLVTLPGVEVRRVTDALDQLNCMAVLGDEVFFEASGFHTVPNLYSCRVRAVNWRSGEARDVYSDDRLSVAQLVSAGDSLYLIGTRGERYGLNENSWIYRLDPATGEITVVRREEYNLYSSVGSDCRLGGGESMMARGDTLYYIQTREGNAHLMRMLPCGESETVLAQDGSVDMIAVNVHSDEALLVGLFDMRLQEVYSVSLKSGEMKRLTHFNDAALENRYVAQPRPLTVSCEGLTISGWVLEPRGFDPGKRYPAVLDIHGGPKTVYGPVFYHEMQLWASMGYFVFFCNPKGSDGRDNAFADIRGAYGQTDYRCLMAFTDAVLDAYPQIDPARVCETGGSYGGFMTNWIIGHTDRFCCAASQRSISNWVSFWGISDIGPFFAADQTAGDLFASPERLWEQSPLAYAAHVKTPTLFIHSDEDYRCPLAEGLQMYSALVTRGVPARLCLFHGENHELSRSGKPLHRVRRLEEITNWFERYARE